MKVLINDEVYPVINNDTFTKKIFSLMFKKNTKNAYLYQNEVYVHTFLTKTLVDVIALNKKNTIIFKYVGTPKNKLIEVMNDKENTDILILPNKASEPLKIGDKLTFIDEDVI